MALKFPIENFRKKKDGSRCVTDLAIEEFAEDVLTDYNKTLCIIHSLLIGQAL